MIVLDSSINADPIPIVGYTTVGRGQLNQTSRCHPAGKSHQTRATIHNVNQGTTRVSLKQTEK